INATGISPALMLRDKWFTMQYGCVVHLQMPDGWDHGVRSLDLGVPSLHGYGLPGATSDPYYITQRNMNRIVVGGTMWPMHLDDATALIENGYQVEEHVADGVLTRAVEHFPELRGLKRIRAVCSIRPCRDEFLMKWDPVVRTLFHVSGFGGSGVTLGPVVGARVALDLIEKVQQSATGC
ncbi:MAG: FAD-binding oxidoreductase, partial [Actinomycetota bacterium]|nr:FAD-binding oxidoreductase [Actinomycetota bacterium]